MSTNTERLKRVLKTRPGKSMVAGAAVGAGVGLITTGPVLVFATIGLVAGAYLGKRSS